MATKQSSTPSLFNFLKEGLLLPTQNRRLFTAVFAVIVAYTSLLLLGNVLAVQPLVDEIRLDAQALNSTDPSSPEYIHLIQQILDDSRVLLLTGAVYLIVSIIVGSAIKIVVLFAAVATYSGEPHTFASLLGKATAQLRGPVLTVAFVYALGIAYFALLAFVTAFIALLMFRQSVPLLLVLWLVLLVGCVFFVYLSFMWSLSIVVAVAEPGCHDAGAVGRAWRLMKGKRRRAVLFIFVTGVLAAAVSPVHALAKACAVSSMASGLLLGFLYTILMAAVGLFAACAMTAFYYECKESTKGSATEYIKVPTKEEIDALII